MAVPYAWWALLRAASVASLPSSVRGSGDTRATPRLLQEPAGGFLRPGRGPSTVHGRALRSDRTGERTPRPLDCALGCVPAPPPPHRTWTAMQGCLHLGAVRDAPAVHGGMSPLHPACLPACFALAHAQWRRHLPADSPQNDLLGTMGPCATDRPRRLPPDAPWLTGGDPTSNRFTEEWRYNPSAR